MPPRHPTLRFSDRADAYARNRPGYPAGLTALLRAEIGLDPAWVLADVGSGTGLSSEPFLTQGNRVYAVEPDAAMRRAAETRHAAAWGFHSVDASAEHTGLPDASVDLVVAAQAFHWFDPALARREFRRILREPPWVALFWNMRRTHASDLMRGYEALIDEFRTGRGPPRPDLAAFYGGPHRQRSLAHEHVLDYEGLEGLLLSASYTPSQGHERHAPMLQALRDLFDRNQSEGRVRFLYETLLYVGALS